MMGIPENFKVWSPTSRISHTRLDRQIKQVLKNQQLSKDAAKSGTCMKKNLSKVVIK